MCCVSKLKEIKIINSGATEHEVLSYGKMSWLGKIKIKFAFLQMVFNAFAMRCFTMLEYYCLPCFITIACAVCKYFLKSSGIGRSIIWWLERIQTYIIHFHINSNHIMPSKMVCRHLSAPLF